MKWRVSRYLVAFLVLFFSLFLHIILSDSYCTDDSINMNITHASISNMLRHSITYTKNMSCRWFCSVRFLSRHCVEHLHIRSCGTTHHVGSVNISPVNAVQFGGSFPDFSPIGLERDSFSNFSNVSHETWGVSALPCMFSRLRCVNSCVELRGL